MPLGISPLVDFAFKLMLASRGHEQVTIHFLNAILGELVTITKIVILNPLVGPNFQDDKWVVLDILAEDERGRRYNIEMQTSVPVGLRQRLAFYDARLYADQMREADQYHELRPAIVICVLEKPLLTNSNRLHSDFRLRDESGNVLTDDLQVHLLELTKLTVTRENLKSATPAEKWAYFLLNADKMTMQEIQELLPDPEFAEAAGVLEMIKENPDQMNDYISRLKYTKDEAWRIAAAQSEGEAKGRIEGLQEGRLEGRLEGELIGAIEILQQVLGVTEPSRDELFRYDREGLSDLREQLQTQLRNRQTN